MSNLISDRISFFLKEYPPFSFLSENELDQVAQKITVKYFEKGSIIFKEGSERNDFCYVLNQGNVKLLKERGSSSLLVDQCEPGDVFGVRSILTGNPYVMTAECIEESLVYAIPKNLFKEYLDHHQEFALFFASGYAAGQVIVREDLTEADPLETTSRIQKLTYSKKVVTCGPSNSVFEAAHIMREHHVGSIIIVNEKQFPLGIVTDTDLRNKVLAEQRSPQDAIHSIMSSPVMTIQPSTTLSEVMIEMIRSGVHHLVMTEDGSINSRICGIVSDHDVVVSQQNHPAALIKSIKYSNDPENWAHTRDKTEELLKDYLDQGVHIGLISSLITKINDTIITKALDLAVEEVKMANEISFCWLNLGSEGREEQLLRTDQDNAIVFEDTRDNQHTQTILLELANRVNDILIQCGFEACPAEIMARNPKYCRSISEWKQYFSGWITTPDPKAVMNATIFFDFRAAYGNVHLVERLEKHLLKEIKENELFIHFLAQNALQNPPPLSFFNNFLVERGGQHKDEFDIKKRGMMPLSDAARLLVLDHHITGVQNTEMRYKKLAELEPKYASLFESAEQAYEIFMRHRAKNGLEKGDSGRFIDLNHLNKLEKQVMKNAFLTIKEIQDVIKVRFQQSYFN